MKYTLKETLHAINVLDESRDIYVEGFDGFAVTAPVRITPEGRQEFALALKAKMYDSSLVSDADDRVNENAWRLISSLAGYCPSSDFDRWFEGPDAKAI